jgi:hypothetical protein
MIIKSKFPGVEERRDIEVTEKSILTISHELIFDERKGWILASKSFFGWRCGEHVHC